MDLYPGDEYIVTGHSREGDRPLEGRPKKETSLVLQCLKKFGLGAQLLDTASPLQVPYKALKISGYGSALLCGPPYFCSHFNYITR